MKTTRQTSGADSISVTKGNPAAPLAGTTEPHVGAVYDVRLIDGEIRYLPVESCDT